MLKTFRQNATFAMHGGGSLLDQDHHASNPVGQWKVSARQVDNPQGARSRTEL